MPRQERTFQHNIPNFKRRLVREVISTTPLSQHKDEVTEVDTVLWRFMAPEDGELTNFRTFIAVMGEQFANLKILGTFGGRSWDMNIKVPRLGIKIDEKLSLKEGERLTVLLSPSTTKGGSLDTLRDIWLSCMFKTKQGRPVRIEESDEER